MIYVSLQKIRNPLLKCGELIGLEKVDKPFMFWNQNVRLDRSENRKFTIFESDYKE